ncbi:MAG: O-antigen ligase family protein [Candidatus Edwardsbacteria bacterium]|jgi:O-antigen ligase|nr:O-antigen ligase family protein [Candidatus Edwardsbacteria bacterium]
MPLDNWGRLQHLGRTTLLRDLLIAVAVIFLVSNYIYRYVFYPGSGLAPMMVLAFCAVLILWRPVYGIALMLVTYPFAPSTSGVGVAKMGVALLLGYNLFLWVWANARRGRKPWTWPEYRWIFIFTAYLCLSPLLGMKNGFSVSDWLRDIAPLLVLLMIPVMADHFGEVRSRWLVYLVVVPVAAGLLRDVLFLLNRAIGLGLAWVSILPVRLSTLHPPLFFMAGLALFISRAPRRNWWLALALLALAAAGLTQTRTVWLAMAFATLLILFFFTKYRAQAVVLMVLLIMGTLFFLYFSKGAEQVFSSQEERMRSLIDYQHDMSYQNRSKEFMEAGRLFLRSPVLGMGYGYQYKFYRFIQHIGMGYLETNFTHNDVVNVAAKGGLFGLFLLFMLFRGLLHRLRARVRDDSGKTAGTWAVIAMTCCFLSLFVGSSTPVLQTREASFIMAVVIAMGLSYGEKRGDAPVG